MDLLLLASKDREFQSLTVSFSLILRLNLSSTLKLSCSDALEPSRKKCPIICILSDFNFFSYGNPFIFSSFLIAAVTAELLKCVCVCVWGGGGGGGGR